MAGSIKGIIVEIGGDTSKLQNALKKVNTTTSSLNKELKGINSLLKLDPKNTELVAQKQKVLKENIEQTSENLKTMKGVQEQVYQKWQNYIKNEDKIKKIAVAIKDTKTELQKLKKEQEEAKIAFDKGEISKQQYNEICNKVKSCKTNLSDLIKEQKQFNETTVPTENYRNFQREIINAESKLKSLKVEASKWTTAGRSIEEFGNKVSNISTKVDNLGNKLTTRLTLPILGVATVLTKSAMEQETAIQQVEKIYGNASQTIRDFAENSAISFNMSTNEAYKYAQIYGNLIQSITTDQAQNAQYTQELLKASAVIASATGRTMEDVMDRIRSGLLGNTEAIEDLGVNVNVALLESTDAFKKFAGDKSWNQLDFQTQQQIRLFGILEQTTKKYGNEINENTASKTQKLTARFENMANKIGKNLLPIANKLLDVVDEGIDKLDDLSDEEIENIVNITKFAVAIGPAIKIIGTLGKGIGGTIKTVGDLSQAICLIGKTSTKAFEQASSSTQTLAKVLTGLTSPAGIATIAIGTVTAGITALIVESQKSQERVKNVFNNMGEGAKNFVTGIENAKSHLDSFNSTLFTSSEEQQKLQEDMDNVQKGITEICKRASNERRDYTQQEITQLDQYFTKLKELKDRELEIQKSIGTSITQQATQNAQTFQGNLAEYQAQSEEWIKTAQEQATKEIQLINDRTTQEVALLQQRYGKKATMENEEYAREYNAIIANKETAIYEATDQVGKVMEVYNNGYTERALKEEEWLSKVFGYSQLEESENSRHANVLKQIEEDKSKNYAQKQSEIEYENAKHTYAMNDIWDRFGKDMRDEEAQELGSWMIRQANTEMYGGQISDENKKMVDKILGFYDEMPPKTKEAMKNAMAPMLTEMENKEPSLFSKASGIAEGILSRLKKSFDIHSPSKKTRKIFNYAMEGAELGIQDEEKNIYKQIDKFAKNTLDKFNNINTNFQLKTPQIQDFGKLQAGLNSQIVDRTNTVFTTPQIVFNVQELDDEKLQQCFNYINKKFGSKY